MPAQDSILCLGERLLSISKTDGDLSKTFRVTRLAAKTLLKGTTTRSAEQIADQLEAVGGEITAQAGNNSFAVNLDVTQPDLALGTDILADVLLNATMPAKAVAREKEIQLAKIKDEDEKPTSVARNLVKRALFPGHPLGLRPEGTPESVSRLTSKRSPAFRDRYVVARNGVIAVFGNVKATGVSDLFEQKLGALPSGELALRNPTPSPMLTKTKFVETEREKAQAVLIAGFRGADLFNPDRYALELIYQRPGLASVHSHSRPNGSRLLCRCRPSPGPGTGLVRVLSRH